MKRALLFALVLGGCTHPQGPAAAPAAGAPPAARATPSADFRDHVPEPGPADAVRIPAPEVAKLENGLTLYVLRRPARVVSVRVLLRAGSNQDPAGKSGLAALTARLASEETKDHDSTGLAEAIESLGATLSRSTGRQSSELGLTVLPADVPRALSLLAEIVERPAFRPKTFERVRSEWLDGLTADRQRVERLSTLAGFRLLLGPRLGAPTDGSLDDVKKLTITDLRRFHDGHVTPAQAAVILVGDLDLSRARKAVDGAFGAWRARQAEASAPPAPPPAPESTQIVLVDRPGAVQSALFVAQPFPRLGQPGLEARELLSGAMGGLFTSRINKNLREEHAYTYGARSTVVESREFGAFIVSTSVQRDVTAPALSELLKELRAAPSDRPITLDELARARADRVSRLGAHLEHVDRMANDLSELFEEGLPDDWFQKRPEDIAAVTLSDIRSEAKRLDVAHLVVVVVGDAAAVRPALEKQFTVVSAAADLTK
ncbi:MAG: insulinase family protein [Myxococcales bacterium]|nr:insulinase family protein [Myxococcales bacterium]